MCIGGMFLAVLDPLGLGFVGKSAILWMDATKGNKVKNGTGHRHSIWEDDNIGNG